MPREKMDQAVGLRNRMANNPQTHLGISTPELPKIPVANQGVRVIAVSSGKGGVGKSSVVVNLAMALDRLGKRVLILDADLGLANIDILLGLVPQVQHQSRAGWQQRPGRCLGSGARKHPHNACQLRGAGTHQADR